LGPRAHPWPTPAAPTPPRAPTDPRQGSPLVYGVKRGQAPGSVQVWLSSDSAALLVHTRDIVVGA
jgi:hypothetical protein